MKTQHHQPVVFKKVKNKKLGALICCSVRQVMLWSLWTKTQLALNAVITERSAEVSLLPAKR